MFNGDTQILERNGIHMSVFNKKQFLIFFSAIVTGKKLVLLLIIITQGPVNIPHETHWVINKKMQESGRKVEVGNGGDQQRGTEEHNQADTIKVFYMCENAIVKSIAMYD